jgi:3-oxoacyl-[acyl-carrier-protein] synthase-3
MEQSEPVGILGAGAYLPTLVRKNDWWPENIVADWRQRAADRPRTAPEPPPSPGVARAMAGMSAVANDPFQGAVERRVLGPDMPVYEMEARAARRALERAQVAASEVDFLLSYSMIPDYFTSPSACAVHRELGLRNDCFTTSIDGVCNSFLLQLSLAEQMIRGGQARCGLLVQSSAITPLVPREEPFSAWVGDGAAAVVVGKVSEGRGILGRFHRTDGTLYGALVVGNPEGKWYGQGPCIAYSLDSKLSMKMLLGTPDYAYEGIHGALSDAGLGAADVDFVACHQATAWMRCTTLEYCGLGHAKSTEIFPWTGSMSAVNIPFQLSVAQDEGLIDDDDVLVMQAGGTGVTWSGIVARWGR